MPDPVDLRSQLPALTLEVRREGRLVGRWALDEGPLEMSIRDGRTGAALASFTARAGEVVPEPEVAPASAAATLPEGDVDEVVVDQLERTSGDDLTMPFPDATATGASSSLPDPETEEAAQPRSLSQSRRRRGPAIVRNLAKLADAPPLGPLDEETFHDEQFDLNGMLDEDREISRTAPSGLTDALIAVVPEATVGAHLEPELIVRPAEVWIRRANSWRSAGQLLPGRKASSRGGWVELRLDGTLAVDCGPELVGTATLPDGRTIELDGRLGLQPLSAGASVIIRSADHGIYVRSELPERTSSFRS